MTTYIRSCIYSNSGPATLTVFNPDLAWVCKQFKQITYDLHAIQSAVINVGEDFMILERSPYCIDLDFVVHCYHAYEHIDSSVPEIDVLDYFPSNA